MKYYRGIIIFFSAVIATLIVFAFHQKKLTPSEVNAYAVRSHHIRQLQDSAAKYAFTGNTQYLDSLRKYEIEVFK